MIQIDGVKYKTVAEAAQELGITKSTLHAWVAQGVVPKPPILYKGQRAYSVYTEEYMVRARAAVTAKRHEHSSSPSESV